MRPAAFRLLGLLLALACLLAAAPTQPAWAGQSFVDDSGQAVTISAPYRRIISLYPAHSENLFALGLDQEIIGVAPGEDHPPAALAKPVFSYHDDPERFLAARPDLVLIRPMIARGYAQLVQRLRQAGIAVVSLQPNTVDEMLAYWRRLGQLSGHEAQAEALVQGFQTRLAGLRARVAAVPSVKRPRVYFESIHRKMKTFAPDSMAVFALEAAGGRNLAQEAVSVRGTNIAEFGKEHILSLAHEMDLYLAQVGTMNKVTVEEIKEESGFAALKAVAQGRVYLIDERLVSRPTPRLLEGIAAIQNILYPKLSPEARP